MISKAYIENFTKHFPNIEIFFICKKAGIEYLLNNNDYSMTIIVFPLDLPCLTFTSASLI